MIPHVLTPPGQESPPPKNSSVSCDVLRSTPPEKEYSILRQLRVLSVTITKWWYITEMSYVTAFQITGNSALCSIHCLNANNKENIKVSHYQLLVRGIRRSLVDSSQRASNAERMMASLCYRTLTWFPLMEAAAQSLRVCIVVLMAIGGNPFTMLAVYSWL